MPPMLKFILLLIFQIPAVSISILIFFYFTHDRNIRSKPKHHIWFLLLLLNFLYLVTDLPLTMGFFYRGRALVEKDGFCVWWTWYELSLNILGLQLMAWASIERHLFIFHSHTIMRVRWKTWTLHYIPIVLCSAWILAFHFVLIVMHPICTHTWRFEQNLCGNPCFWSAANRLHGWIEFVGNIVFPLTIITVANVTLIIRVIYQKISHHQIVHWRRHRKMTFQLWIISSVYLAFWLPLAISQIIRWTVMPTFFLAQVDTMLFIIYFIPLLLPVVCLNTYPELLAKIQQIMPRRLRRNRVGVPVVRTLN